MTNNAVKLSLRGPAGLFKSKEKHKLCWGLLNKCNTNISECPIDVLTFHRKGQQSYNDIIIKTKQLLNIIYEDYKHLNELPFANTEADPFSGWSKNLTIYSNVHYAVMLINIVFDHWNALYTNELKNLISISHDNAFLSYHPYEFEQRTLLARFQMNETKPYFVDFIQKPVYAALGLLSSLGKFAAEIVMTSSKNVSYLTTISENYAAVLLTSNPRTTEDQSGHCNFKINLHNFYENQSNTTLAYFVEHLQSNLTDPFYIWENYGRPSYPNASVMREIVKAQVAFIFFLLRMVLP